MLLGAYRSAVLRTHNADNFAWRSHNISYDLRLFFPQQEFPYQEWSVLLALFNAMPYQNAIDV